MLLFYQKMEEEASNTPENTVSNDEKLETNVDATRNDSDTGGERNEPARTEEEKMRYCKHCEYLPPDWPMFAAHVLKPSHVKKVAAAMNVRVAVDPLLTSLTCHVCNITCAGHIPWNAHLLGAKHRKNKELLEAAKERENSKSQMLKQSQGGPMRNNQYGSTHNNKPYNRSQNNYQPQPVNEEFSSYPQPLIGLEYVTESALETEGKIQRYHCSICDVKFDDNLKFPHLVGQKHRLNVLKLKRPDSVKGIDSATMKRSEITPILLQEAMKLEQEEGRFQVKTKFKRPGANFQGRGTIRGGQGGTRGTTKNTRGSTGIGRGGRGNSRGTRGNRGTWNTRGNQRQQNMGRLMDSYPTQPGPGGYSSYNDHYGDELPYNTTAYNASFDNPNYGRSYTQSYGSGQSNYNSGQSYSGSGQQPYYGQMYSGPPSQVEYSDHQNMPSSVPDNKLKTGNSSGLAMALGDLTKLVQNEDDASIALNVSNALTQALLQYRMTGQE